jgi:hypothetical protein
MKRCYYLLAGLTGFLFTPVLAADTPCGELLELHSCEVYAGGCVVSSEAMQSGRYMLRAWKFTGGQFRGTDLTGLNLAVLQLSEDNLAAPGTSSGRAVVYVPQTATAMQRDTLIAWLRSSQSDFRPTDISTRAVPVGFETHGGSCIVTVGDSISVRTSPFQRCESFTCGESLWYEPRSATSQFAVAVDQSSHVQEPLLQLRWEDGAKRNVFRAKFGEANSNHPLFVGIDPVCGATWF